jgi:hypothetical protein
MAEQEKGSHWPWYILIFISEMLVLIGTVAYVGNVQTYQESWTGFLQTSVTVSSLLVSFGGLIFFNQITAIDRIKTDFWMASRKYYEPLITKTPEGWLSTDTIKKVEEDTVHVDEIMGLLSDLNRTSRCWIFYLITAWGVSAISSLILLLTHTTNPPLAEILLVLSVGALFLEGVIFAEMVTGIKGIKATTTIDAEYIVFKETLDESRRRLKSP